MENAKNNIYSLGFTLQEILLINTDNKWKELFIDRNVHTDVNLYKLLNIKNFGFYLNINEKILFSSLGDRFSEKKQVNNAMTEIFPLNADKAKDIDYLIKPSNFCLYLTLF